MKKPVKSVYHILCYDYSPSRKKSYGKTSPEIQHIVTTRVSRRVLYSSGRSPWRVLQGKIKREVMGRKGGE